MESENWKDIGGYEGYYMVSNYGRIKRLPFKRNNLLTNGLSNYPERILKLNYNTNGYPFVDLCVNNIKKIHLVHRLVAIAFIPNKNHFPFVLHKDDNPSNPKADNLFWGNHHSNMQDMVSKNRKPNGSRVVGSKLKESDIPKIREMIADGVPYSTIANRYGIAKTQITNIKYKRTWKQVN